MKTTLTRYLAAIAMTVVVSSAFAEVIVNPAEQRYKEFMAATPAAKEDGDKILFSAEIPSNMRPYGVSYEIQNGLSDSVIVGLVIAVTYKEEGSDKEHTIELYADCEDTLPLTSREGHVPFFQAERISKLSPKISVKEIRIRKVRGNP